MGHWKQTRTICSRIRARKQKEEDEILAREKAFERGETRGHKTERRGYIYIYLHIYEESLIMEEAVWS